MSRQYNEAMEHRFEIFGEEYDLVEPRNLEDLAEAIRVRELLQQGCDTFEPDSGHPYYHLLRTQQDWISGYMRDLGDFDNSLLTKNIAYLTKKHGIRMGDLEKILGISTGYISRTSKNNSTKRMSIDNVWRIARLFGVELRALLETDLQIPNKNTELIARFLEKLRKQTEDNEITWCNYGGACTDLDHSLRRIPQLRYVRNGTEDDGTLYYRAAHLNPNARFVLADDIYATKDVHQGQELLMIAYCMQGREDSETNYHIDFYIFTPERNNISGDSLQKMFFTLDDRTGTLDTYAGLLMHSVQTQEMDAALAPNMRKLITNYLT